jgi:predicted metal-dependent hydrolase
MIDYITKYSSKRKTIGLVVERDKSVVVLAPSGTSQERLDDFVSRKKFWIYEKINHTPKFQEKEPEPPFKAGKSILYMGKNYRLEVVEESIEGIHFNHKFHINQDNLSIGPALLEQWYKEKAKEKIIPRVKQFAKQMGVSYNKILISDLQYTWGSCTLKGNLNFNYRLIKAPHFVIKYIIIHELAHLIELNHSKRFWTIVQIQMPDYEEARTWLKEHGGRVF